MTLKQKALLQTIALFAGMILLSVGLNLVLMYASVEMIKYAFGLVLAGFLFYGVYGVVLSRLEYGTKLEEINSRT